MKKLLILNGPNINMTGKRERHIYGNKNYYELVRHIKAKCRDMGFYGIVVQTNYEGKLIDLIQKSERRGYCAIIINPGAYAHYSYAIMDALNCVKIPKIEVHISDVTGREDFRKTLITAKACDSVIYGLGFDGYSQAVKKASELL